jgi:hypothetical protein
MSPLERDTSYTNHVTVTDFAIISETDSGLHIPFITCRVMNKKL